MAVRMEHAPQLLKAARDDSGMTQRALADAAGVRQPNIAAIESGSRPVSPSTIERLLALADYRPSLPVAIYREELLDLAARLDISNVRIFGSVARGTDHHDSDVDLLIDITDEAAPFALGAFTAEAERILGFPVDVVEDHPDAPRQIRATAVPL